MRIFVGRVCSVVAVLALAAACRQGAEAGETAGAHQLGLVRDFVISIDQEERVYDVYAPTPHSDRAEPSPVVVLLHGQRSSRSDLEGGSTRAAPYSEWRAVADANNILLMVPQGVDGPNGHAGWNDCRTDSVGSPASDDVSFISAALEQMSETYQVDADRVFAVGTSNGGHMAIRLAQELPHVFAGIGVIAAGMPVNSGCADAGLPISVLFMWGTEDPFAPYGGGAMAGQRGDILSADHSIQYWIDRNQTVSTPGVTAFADIDSGDNSTVDRYLYEGGDDNTAVSFYRVAGGGHVEPSVAHQYRWLFQRVVGEQNHDIEMADEMWTFFRR